MAAQSYILYYMLMSANFIIEGCAQVVHRWLSLYLLTFIGDLRYKMLLI